MEKTLYLEAAREGGNLKIGIHERLDVDFDPSIDPYEVKALSMEKFGQIERLCMQTMDFLGSVSSKRDVNYRALESLKKMGEMLCDELLTPRIKQTLTQSDASFLIIRIDDMMVQIPWELIFLNGMFLCERFSLGRLVRTRQEITGVKSKPLNYPIDMWILSNPGKDLPSADREGDLLLRITDEVNPDDRTILNASLDSSNATPEKISSKIKHSDIVHFAGHAEYDAQNAGQSGWKLSGDYFSPDDIDKMAGSAKMPVIVFSNACRSARTDAWTPGEQSFGLANAFLRAGVNYYVGTSWEIMDTPSTLFACEFYNQLFSGSTIGEAVCNARAEIRRQYSNDYVGWAGYVLYGDPRYRIFDGVKETGTLIHEPITSMSMDAEPLQYLRGPGTDRGASSRHVDKETPRFRLFALPLTIAAVISFMILGVSLYQKRYNLDVSRLNQEWAHKERERKDALIANIAKHRSHTGADVPQINSESKSLTVALVFDAHNAKAGIIAAEMKKNFRQQYGQVTFVERQEINTLLEEVNLAMALPSEKKFQLNMLPADYIIKLGVRDTLMRTELDVSLLSTKRGENLYQDIGEVQHRNHVPDKMIDRIVEIFKNKDQ